MIIYRRNTATDKLVSFLSILLAVFLIKNNIDLYRIFGSINMLDLVVTLIGIGVGSVFLYTSKMKYIELTNEGINWYTWFFIKHTIKIDDIKKVEAKTYYIIIVKENNKEVWIPTRCVKKEALSELLRVLKVEEVE